MLCEQCNQQSATVFLTTVIDGESTQRQLCETCAAIILARMPPAHWTSYTPTEESMRELLDRPADCPAEVFFPDPISVTDLATALHAQFFQVIAVLMELDIYKSADDAIDFATASLVCTHYGVTSHKVA